MKFFFLTDGWTVGRVWEFGGLWNESVWRRKPQIHRMNLRIQDAESHEIMWLYQVEDAVLMVEVKPLAPSLTDASSKAIGQVVLRRLITAEQVIEYLCKAEIVLSGQGPQ